MKVNGKDYPNILYRSHVPNHQPGFDNHILCNELCWREGNIGIEPIGADQGWRGILLSDNAAIYAGTCSEFFRVYQQ